MKTKREIAINQIDLQEKIQKIGINLVTCGNCGTVLLHETKNETIECFCGIRQACDCPDIWYSGIENNSEFDDIEIKYFSINGYWKDDKTEFENYTVSSYNSEEDDDEEIFYFGLSEQEIKEAIKAGEETIFDFVITSYTKHTP